MSPVRVGAEEVAGTILATTRDGAGSTLHFQFSVDESLAGSPSSGRRRAVRTRVNLSGSAGSAGSAPLRVLRLTPLPPLIRRRGARLYAIARARTARAS